MPNDKNCFAVTLLNKITLKSGMKEGYLDKECKICITRMMRLAQNLHTDGEVIEFMNLRMAPFYKKGRSFFRKSTANEPSSQS